MKRVLRDVALGALGCVATVGAGAGALLAASTDAYAQQNQTTAPPQAQATGVAIRRVTVEGNQRIEPATIASYLQVGPGDTFDPERIDMSIKTLFATGLFSDVQIEQRGTDLVVIVSENPIINRVIFEGMRTLDEEDLEDEVQARPRSVFTPARAQADVQRILDVYRRNGRFAAQVTPQVRELDQNRVDLIFEVDEGPVTGIRDINFIGNSEFSDRRLRDARRRPASGALRREAERIVLQRLVGDPAVVFPSHGKDSLPPGRARPAHAISLPMIAALE